MRGDTLVLGTDKEINRFPNDNENTWDGHLNYGNCTFSFFRISMQNNFGEFPFDWAKGEENSDRS